MRTKTITMISVTKSDKECTASAIIAVLLPSIPPTNLNINKKQFAKLPIIVVLYIVFSLKWASFMIQIPFTE